MFTLPSKSDVTSPNQHKLHLYNGAAERQLHPKNSLPKMQENAGGCVPCKIL